MIVAIVDTETNGREPGEVIELAALVQSSAPKVYMPFCHGAGALNCQMRFRRFKPERGSTFKALATHGILDEQLKDSDPSATAASHVADVECFIAHNARFDYGVLGIEPPLVIDTLALSRAFCPDDEGHTLGAMLFRIDAWTALEFMEAAHKADADVMGCARLLDWLVERFVAPTARTWVTLAALSEVFAAPSTIPFGKYKGTAWADLDFGYMRWYLNQSDQDPAIRDRMREEMSYRSGAMARCPHCDGIRAIKDDATNQWSLCDCYKPSVVKS